MHSGTNSRTAIIGGILTIAIADAFSDALGIHVSEEAECNHTKREIWESTISTFLSKLFVAISFLIPVLYLSLPKAIIISIIWGLSLLGLLSYLTARAQETKPWKVIMEHLTIGVIVILATHFIGEFISSTFG